MDVYSVLAIHRPSLRSPRTQRSSESLFSSLFLEQPLWPWVTVILYRMLIFCYYHDLTTPAIVSTQGCEYLLCCYVCLSLSLYFAYHQYFITRVYENGGGGRKGTRRVYVSTHVLPWKPVRTIWGRYLLYSRTYTDFQAMLSFNGRITNAMSIFVGV